MCAFGVPVNLTWLLKRGLSSESISSIYLTVLLKPNADVFFLYASTVTPLAHPPARLDALDPASTRSAVYVTGVNFGLPVVATVAVPSRHSVFIGNSVCGSVLWESDSLLSCRLVGELVVRGV